MPKAIKSVPPGCNPPGVRDPRALDCFSLRFTRATKQAQVAIPSHKDNGDERKYETKIGTYTKCVLQDAPGLVNAAAYKLFRDATLSGSFDDFNLDSYNSEFDSNWNDEEVVVLLELLSESSDDSNSNSFDDNNGLEELEEELSGSNEFEEVSI